ncbi:MAG: hypothetical protein PHE79_01460 [Eubacteriales bacterium]|nr:hypothetical protein [Eubacteriales bacterium]
MKKKLVLLLIMAMVMLAFAACGTEKTKDPEGTPATGDDAKTGLAVITSTEKSVDAGEENGVAQVDSVVVAVTVDDAGTILKCAIDTAQTKIEISNEGKIVTPLDTVFVSKQELGEEYGMGELSSIGKEWSEQANALSDYVIGKTVDEVKGIALNETGGPADEDLAATVTIKIQGYIDAIEKAAANAQNLGAAADDKLGLGVVTTIAKSVDAAQEEGLAQAYTYYTATTFDADGVITSSIIDASQTNLNFTTEGKITSDINASYQTKNELGDAYGMKEASSIGKEWNEQADAFAKYIVGKTLDDVKGISLEAGVPTEEDLTSSVTIHVSDFISILEKANNMAK